MFVKYIIKQLSGNTFIVHFDDSKTIKDLKYEINKKHDIDLDMKLIINGKNLQDSKTLSELSTNVLIIYGTVVKKTQDESKVNEEENVFDEYEEFIALEFLKVIENQNLRSSIIEHIPNCKALKKQNPLQFNKLVKSKKFLYTFLKTLFTNSDYKSLYLNSIGAGIGTSIETDKVENDKHGVEESKVKIELLEDKKTELLTNSDKIEINDIITILGISKVKAINAYIACNKNKTTAINFLLNS